MNAKRRQARALHLFCRNCHQIYEELLVFLKKISQATRISKQTSFYMGCVMSTNKINQYSLENTGVMLYPVSVQGEKWQVGKPVVVCKQDLLDKWL